jgi:hypothetical protein
MGRSLNQIRWTIDVAAGEFGINRATLAKRIRESGMLPGKDQKFSTKEIFKAISGDLEAARIRQANEDADLKKVRKLQIARKLCAVETVEHVWTAALVDIRQRVSNWQIPDMLKQEMLKELQSVNTDEFFPKEAATPELDETEI